MRERKYLTQNEVERLITATKGSRNEARDRCLLLMFRHGLRVSETCGLMLSQIDADSRVLHVSRLKKGLSTTHPLRADELRAIRAWMAQRERMAPDTHAFFVSEQATPEPSHGVGRDPPYGELAGLPLCPSAHAAPCLRLRPGRPGGRYPADPGLSRSSKHPAHRQIYRDEPGEVREVMALRRKELERLGRFVGRVFDISKQAEGKHDTTESGAACKGAA